MQDETVDPVALLLQLLEEEVEQVPVAQVEDRQRDLVRVVVLLVVDFRGGAEDARDERGQEERRRVAHAPRAAVEAAQGRDGGPVDVGHHRLAQLAVPEDEAQHVEAVHAELVVVALGGREHRVHALFQQLVVLVAQDREDALRKKRHTDGTERDSARYQDEEGQAGAPSSGAQSLVGHLAGAEVERLLDPLDGQAVQIFVLRAANTTVTRKSTIGGLLTGRNTCRCS
jgi:hypothetical protein